MTSKKVSKLRIFRYNPKTNFLQEQQKKKLPIKYLTPTIEKLELKELKVNKVVKGKKLDRVPLFILPNKI